MSGRTAGEVVTAEWDDGAGYEGFMGRWSGVLSPAFVKWARIAGGGSVLDVGCGTGALTRALAEGGAARVRGVDLSPGFVAYAAETVGAEHPGVSFEVGDATRLPFPDGTFDAAASCLVLSHVPDPAAMAAEMGRVVRTGGVVAAAVWDYGGGMEMLRHFWDAAVALDLPGARERDEAVRSSVAGLDALRNLFGGIGSGLEIAPIDVPMQFRDFDDYWRPFLAGIGPAGGFVVSLSGGDRERMRTWLERRIPAAPGGGVALVSRALAVRVVKA